MWILLRIELFKIFKRPRTYIPFVAIAAMILIIQLGLKFDGRSYLELMMSSLSDSFIIPYGMIMNGYLVAFVILNTLLIQVPAIRRCGSLATGQSLRQPCRLPKRTPDPKLRINLAGCVRSP